MRRVASLLVILSVAAPVVSSPAAVAGESAVGDPCEGSTTLETNECFGKKLEAADALMGRYLQAATDRYRESGQDAVVLGIGNSQRAFEAYRDIECGAVYERWKEGTIRNVMALGCRLRLTGERTHTIWENWLQYADSTPPILPEPAPAG